IPAVGVATARGSEERQLIDRLAVGAGDAIACQCLANCLRHVRQTLHASDAELLGMLVDEKEPIAAPRYISDDVARAIETDHGIVLIAIARDILHRDIAGRTELGGDDANGSLDLMDSCVDQAEVVECGDQTDHSMATHAEITGAVEKNDAVRAGWIGRRTEQRAYERIRAARLPDDSGTEAVELIAKPVATLGERPHAEVRASIHDDACRLSSCVRVHDAHHSERAAHGEGNSIAPAIGFAYTERCSLFFSPRCCLSRRIRFRGSPKRMIAGC